MTTCKSILNQENPVSNIPRMNEPVATDTIFSDTPAIMMEVPWHSSLLAKIPWYVMHMR